MQENKKLKLCFIGGSQAGVIGLLTILSCGFECSAVVSYFKPLTKISKFYNILTFSTIKNRSFLDKMRQSDVLICVHGREIIDSGQLVLPKFGCFNVHPYLYKYKGANPVGRALRDKNFNASVGVHKMTDIVDKGEVIVEEFVDVAGAGTIDEIYNSLYPYYCIAIIKTLNYLLKKKI